MEYSSISYLFLISTPIAGGSKWERVPRGKALDIWAKIDKLVLKYLSMECDI